MIEEIHVQNCDCDRDYVRWNTGQFPMRSDEKENAPGTKDPACVELRERFSLYVKYLSLTP